MKVQLKVEVGGQFYWVDYNVHYEDDEDLVGHKIEVVTIDNITNALNDSDISLYEFSNAEQREFIEKYYLRPTRP